MDQTDTPHPGSDTQLLTLAEAAARLRMPVATLRYWRHLGTGPDSFHPRPPRRLPARRHRSMDHRTTRQPGHTASIGESGLGLYRTPARMR